MPKYDGVFGGQKVMATFHMWANETGIDSDALLLELRKVTDGIISDIDLMRIGTKLFALGFRTAEEIVALVGVPLKLVELRIVPPDWKTLGNLKSEMPDA